MAARITDAGLSLIAELQSQSATLIVDKFIYAYIDDLDTDSTPPASEAMADETNIVYQADVSKVGYNGPDTVIYSSVLGATVGDFTFNWIGLYCSAHDVLMAVSYVPAQTKKALTTSQMGNMLTKNFALQYTDITDLTGVEINAETWQIDLTARLQQIDERERLSNYDIYGSKYFFDDAFLVVNNGGSYEMQPGVAYIDGIRVVVGSSQTLDFTVGVVQYVYIDTCLNGDITGVEALWTVQISDTELAHYTDAANQQHYLEKIATINADGTVTDERGNGSGGQGNVSDHNTDPGAHPGTFDYYGAAADAIAENMLTADLTINFTPDQTLEEIRAIILATPRNLGGHTLTLKFADGVYTGGVSLLIHFFYGGRVAVYGNSNEFTYATSKSVKLQHTGNTGFSMEVYNCEATIDIKGLEISSIATTIDSYYYCMCINNSNNVNITGCAILGHPTSALTAIMGVHCSQSNLSAYLTHVNQSYFGWYFNHRAFGAVLVSSHGSDITYDFRVERSAVEVEDLGRANFSNAIVTGGGGTINGHSADRVGNIEKTPKSTIQDALIMRGDSFSKTDRPLLVTWAYANGLVKTAAQLAADPALRTYFTEHATNTDILYLPDWRGVSERGLDTSGVFDPNGAGRALMSYQADEIKSHNHLAGIPSKRAESNSSAQYGSEIGVSAIDDYSGAVAATYYPYTSSTGGNETRSKNVAVNYFIYYN